MPQYEFSCPDCYHSEEAVVKLAQADVRRPCPRCGSPMIKQPSAPGFSFKGKSAGTKPRFSIR